MGALHVVLGVLGNDDGLLGIAPNRRMYLGQTSATNSKPDWPCYKCYRIVIISRDFSNKRPPIPTSRTFFQSLTTNVQQLHYSNLYLPKVSHEPRITGPKPHLEAKVIPFGTVTGAFFASPGGT